VTAIIYILSIYNVYTEFNLFYSHNIIYLFDELWLSINTIFIDKCTPTFKQIAIRTPDPPPTSCFKLLYAQRVT